MQSPSLDHYRTDIEAALAYAGDTHTFDDVVAAVAEGKARSWPGPHSVIITEMVEYPRSKHIHFWIAGGNLAELEQMTPIILDWARTQGCTKASLAGRRGWERTFIARTGWKQSLVVFEKSLHVV
jgi:hypothetical protein